MSYIRGLGRGRGAASIAQNEPTSKPGVRKPVTKQVKSSSTAEERFKNASKIHAESVNRHLAAEKSKPAPSSQSNHDDEINDALIQKITASYQQHDAGDVIQSQSLVDVLMNEDSNICLICLDSIDRTEKIWNCGSCYCTLHMECIQQWINEGAYQQRLHTLSEQHFPNKKMPWHCPKCRTEYEHNQSPSVYKCFCGKTENPEDDPWLLPHSCGETCQRPLKPECGHSCLLLCHPGPCPPCPKSVKVACYCGQNAPAQRRCGSSAWSCGQRCVRMLECKQHRCNNLCHAGDCQPCPKTSTQSCHCGKQKQSRPCAQPMWSCDEVCDARLACGHHYCTKTCHPRGECGPCPRSANRRYCPCGKGSVLNLACTEDVQCCGDTCNKQLSCGIHLCTEKCHNGNCGQCLQVSVKSCRCGAKQKELPCAKAFTCETRCQKMKSCGRHACKRRCCDGLTCSECDQPCNKKLKCGNHKCTMPCHDGPCYPCLVTIDKSCHCGSTKVSIPCIRQKTAQPPRCRRPCTNKPKCDHPAIQKHACHFGGCPSCELICEKSLKGCTHRCTQKCHDAVFIKVQSERKVLAGPWEQQDPSYFTQQRQACPPCPYPLTVTCKGGHEGSSLPCSNSSVYSCNRECSRILSCTNHTCTMECHSVTYKSASQANIKLAGIECLCCDEDCSKIRPEGCTHPCLKPCHPGSCPPCKQSIKTRCHCNVTMLYFPCHEWTHESFDKDEKLSCPGLCPKELSCGHPCSLPCHPVGHCQTKCGKKVTLRCKCRTVKQTVLCHVSTGADSVLQCTEKCQEKITMSDTDHDMGSQSEAHDEDIDAASLLPGRRQRKRKDRRTAEEATTSYMPSIETVKRYGLFIAAILAVVLAFYYAITSED